MSVRPRAFRRPALQGLGLLVLVAAVATVTPAATADHPAGTVSPYDWACSGTVPEDGFTDVGPDNLHEPAIDCAVAHGLAAGTERSTYSPHAPVTRAQMATFVVRLLAAGGSYLPGTPPDAFDDDGGNPHEGAVNQLAAVGLVRGTGERTYSPGAAVTRGQMATYLAGAYERRWGVELPQARDRFVDDDGLTHERSIDQAAGLRVTSGVSETAYDPAASVRRDQMARFLAATYGCMKYWPRDGQHHLPQCDAYTEIDGLEALQGLEIEVTTDAEHYTLSQGVVVTVRACNRRTTELRQVFPQKEWFALEARHERLSRSGARWGKPDRQWYDHRWSHTLNRAGYTDRDSRPLSERVGDARPQLAGLTWFNGPQGGPDEVVVWQAGECKTLDVGAWQQGSTSIFVDMPTFDYPAQWRYRPSPLFRTAPGWHTLRLHWGGVEVGRSRRYLTVDSARFNLDGPRLDASFEQRRYEVDEPVPITVSACNDTDRPYDELMGRSDTSGGEAVFQLSLTGNYHGAEDVGSVAVADGERDLSWAPGECKTWELSWDQRFGDRSRALHESVQLQVHWNASSDERPQYWSSEYMPLD